MKTAEVDSSSVSLHFVTPHLVRSRYLEVRIADLCWYVKQKCCFGLLITDFSAELDSKSRLGCSRSLGCWCGSFRAVRLNDLIQAKTCSLQQPCDTAVLGYEGNQSSQNCLGGPSIEEWGSYCLAEC